MFMTTAVMLKYSFEDYNENQVLKIHWTLLWSFIYLLKHYWLAMVPMLKNLPGIGTVVMDLIPPTATQFVHEHSTMPLLLSCVPTLLVTIAAYQRQSINATNAGTLVRWLWKRGVWLLLLTMFLEMGIMGWYIWFGLKELNEVIVLVGYLDLVVIIFLVRSQRVRDIFAEFPERDEERWQQAVQENTLPAYQAYIGGNYVKNHQVEAYRKMDELAWQQAQQEDTAEAYRHYLDVPIANKRHSYEARKSWEELLQNQK